MCEWFEYSLQSLVWNYCWLYFAFLLCFSSEYFLVFSEINTISLPEILLNSLWNIISFEGILGNQMLLMIQFSRVCNIFGHRILEYCGGWFSILKEKLSPVFIVLFVIVYVISEEICLIYSNGFKARESKKRIRKRKVFELITLEFKNAY